ncbi:hypothetical protein VOLCADRAFT_116438, partial [Volvox carteri f. nagariensis]
TVAATAPKSAGAPFDPEALAAALTARMSAAGASIIFEKALTASDVSGGGRVVVPKSIAEQYFPKLEQPSGVTISATDLDGRSYTFKWRFWVNNSSRMYLLEGAGELHRNYGLEVGDVMVFAQKADGSLMVAGRAASKGAAAAAAAAQPIPGRLTAGGGPSTAVASADASLLRGGGGGGRKRKVSSSAATAAAATGAAVGGLAADPTRFRVRPGDEGLTSLAVLDMEAPSDGIFRAVVQHVSPVSLGVALARNNRWTATLEVAGEFYQAFFDSREDAVEAVTAAGASP